MKKSLKKVIMSCAAMAIVSMISVSAMAATYDAATGAVTLTNKCPETSDQATIIIFSADVKDDTNLKDEDIKYIMQLDAKADGTTFTGKDAPKLPTGLTEGKYKIKMGGTNVGKSGIVAEDLIIGESGGAYDLGDANDDGALDTSDAIAIVDWFLEKPSTFLDTFDPEGADILAVADTNGDQAVDTGDAIAVVDYFLEKPSDVLDQKYPNGFESTRH